MISHITFAKGFLVLGTLAAVIGIIGGLLLVIAWISDRWQRRDRKPEVKIAVDVRPALRGLSRAERDLTEFQRHRRTLP